MIVLCCVLLHRKGLRKVSVNVFLTTKLPDAASNTWHLQCLEDDVTSGTCGKWVEWPFSEQC